MSLETNKYYLTVKGNEMLRRAINGERLEITSVKFGSGALPEEPEDAQNLTALVNPKQSVLINSMVVVDSEARITAAVTNDKLEAGYYALEGGLFAKDMDTGEETLFAVAKLDGNFVPAYSSDAEFNQIYTIHIVVGQASVTLTTNMDLYLLKKDALTIDQVFPVGTVRLSFGNEDPNKLWPSTKWERIAEGVALISAGANYTAGKQYGSNTQPISRENLPKAKIPLEIQESGVHQHRTSDYITEMGFDTTNGGGESGGGDPLRIAYGDNRPYHNLKRAANTGSAGGHTHAGNTVELGSGKALNVMQASMAINFWRRVA